jgi:RNA methyltransferase, TrmH family
VISSTNNAAVKKVVRLRKRRERLRRALMIVEGHAAVGAALDAGMPLIEVFHTPGAALRRGSLFARLGTSTAKVVECSERVITFLAGTDHPPDVLAVAPLREASLAEASAGDFCVVLSEIRDPAVVGGIMAAATGAGATSVIAMKGTADIFAPAAIRAAAGAHFVVPVAAGYDASTVAGIFGGGRRLVALVATGEGTDVADAALKPPLALIVCGSGLPTAFDGAERVTAGASAGGVGPGIGARAAIALEEIRRGVTA